jgi:hypothetical protein
VVQNGGTYVLWKYGGMMWTGFISLRIGIGGANSSEHGNEPSGDIQSGEFLD